MCIIHYFPQSIEINVDGLHNGADFNNDGHGWAVASERHGIERGGSMKFDEALADVLDARARHGSRSAVVFHSRWATHGETSEFNIHPFWVGENSDTIMAHNGVLPAVFHPSKFDRRSDTRVFVDQVAPYFARTGNPSRRQGGQLASIIGSGNKLVFMSVASGRPKVRIINSGAGIWDGGAWYSNDGYLPSKWSWRDTGWGGYSHGGWDTEADYDGWVKDEDSGVWSYVGKGMSSSRERFEVCEETGWQYDLELEQYACWSCEGRVSAGSGYCTECDLCQECFTERDECDCYTPPALIRARSQSLEPVEV